MTRPMADGFALVNADVWTMRSLGDRAEAVVVHRGRFEFVGREDRAMTKARKLDLEILDVDGCRILPGMIDGHTHLVHQGILARRVDLDTVKTRSGALRKVREAAKDAKPGELVLAERFDESTWTDEKEWPTKAELDRISDEHPIIVRRIDGHVAVANSIAMEEVARVLDGVDKQRGWLVEQASLELHRVYPTPVPHATEAAATAQKLAVEKGITSVHDFVHPMYFRGWQTLHRRGKLRLKVTATPYVQAMEGMLDLGLETRFGAPPLRLGGVKLFADGSIGAHTAALTKEYGDDGGNLGRLNYTEEQLQEIFDQAQDGGLQISVHAIGDAAIDQVLERMELLPKKDRERLRHRIEHFEMGRQEHWQKANDLGLVVSMQPNFLGGDWSEKDGMYSDRFGDKRYKETNQLRKMYDDGIPIAFGSDCMPLDPWFGLEQTVNAPFPAQRLKIEEALECYTKNAAFGIHADKDRGVLEKGRAADLIVVEGDWKKEGGIAATKVHATAIDGQWVHRERKFRTRS